MKKLNTYTSSLHSIESDYEYSNHHLLRFFRLWLNGDYCSDSEQRDKQRASMVRIIKEFSEAEVKYYLRGQFEKHLTADGIVSWPHETAELFENERFYNEVKSDFYKLIAV